MALQVGIVGLPNVGKSTLFNALTSGDAAVAPYPFTTIEPNLGVVNVPDTRLEALSRLVEPELTTAATIEFVDIAGLVRGAHQGEGLGNQFLGHIRSVNAVAIVCRCFKDADLAHVEGTVDPVRDLEILQTELVLADLEMVERRLERVRSSAKANPRLRAGEIRALEAVADRLGRGERAEGWTMEDHTATAPTEDLPLLTAKRRVYVANVREDDLPGGGPLAAAVVGVAAAEHAPSVVLCAELEAGLAEWPDDEAATYRAAVGLERSGLELLAKGGYETLDLITFFTIVGGREVRAWPVPRGTVAPAAAGVVHSQMEQGFIRARVIRFDTLATEGSWQSARDRGLVRTEGRDYVIQDGDICLFRFSP